MVVNMASLAGGDLDITLGLDRGSGSMKAWVVVV